MVSKSAVDRAGALLAETGQVVDEYELLEREYVFDDYRAAHLQPLTFTTQELQQWLQHHGGQYHVAQRLKRKPQILRKLRRFSVRLSQLQDIGGVRIIVDDNSAVDELINFLEQRVAAEPTLKLHQVTDYRVRGRDDSGYRAVHMILIRDGLKLELQIRSRIQHYWAESIERTSVIYGQYLKELEGDRFVLGYFKFLSDLFFEIESGQTIQTWQKLKLDMLRNKAEQLIQQADTRRVFDSFVNEGIVKTLEEKERSIGGSGVNNWLIVFNWNEGTFVDWDVVSLDPREAITRYAEAERRYPAEQGFEVVLVGSSRVASIRETHSHYFGLEQDTAALKSLDESIARFSRSMDLDVGARQILACMYRKHFWGKKTVSADTLRNHYCAGVLTFDSSLDALVRKGLVHAPTGTGGYALDIKRKAHIERYL